MREFITILPLQRKEDKSVYKLSLFKEQYKLVTQLEEVSPTNLSVHLVTKRCCSMSSWDHSDYT